MSALLNQLVFEEETFENFIMVETIQMIYFLFKTASKVGDHCTLSVFVILIIKCQSEPPSLLSPSIGSTFQTARRGFRTVFLCQNSLETSDLLTLQAVFLVFC